MRSHLRETFLRDTHAQQPIAIVTYIAFALALVPILGALGQAISHRSWAAAFYGMFFAALGLLAYSQLRWQRSPRLPQNVIFQPFVDISMLDVWPRPLELDGIHKALDTSLSVLPVVVGPSGAGKTVLLHRILQNEMNFQSIAYRYVDEYAGFRENLTNMLTQMTQKLSRHGTISAHPYRASPVIVLDQFEQYLAYLRRLDPDKRIREQEWLESCITSSIENHICRFILSVRSEWYYDLRFLGKRIPTPSECITVFGPRVDATSDLTRVALAARLEKVVHEDDIVETIMTALGRGRAGSLLMLETQIVGAVIEREQLLGQSIDASYLELNLGGVEGAINSYFDGILHDAPDPRVTMKVLCALSVRTNFRRQEPLGDLLDRVFEDADEVRTALEYLVQRRLVVQQPTARYELAHDYLAEYFHQKSGSELDPTERDNVLYHFEGDQSRMSMYVLSRSRRNEPRRGKFALAIMVPLVFVMTVRLFDFGLPWPRVAPGLPPQLLWDHALFDVTYLPIYVAHLAWATYIVLFYDRFFSRLDERPAQRLFSRFTVVNLALGALAAVFVPYVWLLAMGWVGLVIGFKLISISKMRDLNNTAKVRFGRLGIVATTNLFFLSTLGAMGLWVSFHYVKTPSTAHIWVYVSCLFSVIMVYTCSAMSPLHVQQKGVSQLLGLMARSRSGVAPRVEM